MSTWGSYFSSYVKKKPTGENADTAPKVDAIPEKSPITKVDISILNAPTPVATAVTSKPPPVRKPTDGFQRANSNAKKLYEIPKEPVIKDGLAGQKAASNASRVAKMFGYAASAYTASVAEKKPELPVSPLIAMVEATELEKPELKVDRPVSPLVAMVAAAVPKKPEPKVMPIVDAVLKYKRENIRVPAKPKTKKDEVQDMLDFFASQLDAPGDALALPSDKKVDATELQIVESKEVATQPVKDKPKAMDMLDFFSSQLDSTDDPFALPGDKKSEAPKSVVKTKPKAIDMLGFFSSQLDSADDMFALPGDQKTGSPKQVGKEQPQPQEGQVWEISQYLSTLKADNYQKESSIPPLTRKDSGWSSQGSSTSQELNMIMASPKSKIWSRQASRTSSELNPAMNGRKDSVWSQQGSPISSERAMSIKKRTSQIEQDVVQIRGRILSYGENDEQLKLERERRDAEHERIVELQNQARQIIIEREQMEMERDRMLEEQLRFEKEAERITEEAESMRKFVENVERERQLDLENQEKKRRRKEAEDQARREAEEAERRRIEAEEEAERIRLETEEEARREAELAAEIEAESAAREIEKERKRVEELERKEQYKAKEDRLAKEEADRLTAKMMKYEEEKNADRRYYGEEEERKRDVTKQKELNRREYEEDQERKREVGRQRRLAAKERQEEDGRLRYEAEAAEEARAIEEERLEKQQRREAEKRADQLFKEEEERRLFEQERQLYEQEQADQRYQQAEAERTRGGGADRLANAYRFDLDVASKPMLSPSVYEDERYESEEEEREETKEEKLAKAEEKIRMAFAGLAVERGQAPAPAPATAALPRSNTVRNDRGPGGYGGFGPQPNTTSRQERGVSRYNTTGGATRLQKLEMPQAGLTKVNTVTGRSAGLPSGPRAGGLPSGPRLRK